MHKRMTIIGVALAAIAVGVTGCLSTKTTETWSRTKQADGSYLTNYTKTISAKHQDPLKDKVVRVTEKSVGLNVQVLPAPAGTSGGLSPLKVLFGMEKLTYVSFPVYWGGGTNGYTPPLSYAASGTGSLWNDADVENMSTASGLLPTNAYYPASTTAVNLLQPTSGTVTLPAPVVNTNTPSVTSTNATGG